MRRLRYSAPVVGSLSVALLIASCSGGSHAARRAPITSAPAPARSSTTPQTTPPPPGPMQPVVVLRRLDDAQLGSSVVGDEKSGVWFLFADHAGLHLDHLDAAGTVRAIPMPQQFGTGLSAWNSMIAVDPDGTVWALGQRALAEVKPGASTPTLFPLGSWPNHEIHGPEALASDGRGHLAIAFQDTTLVRIFNARSSTFSDLQLPVGTDAYSLRYFGDGSLAMGLYTGANYETNTALIASPDGSLSHIVPADDVRLVNAYSNTQVLFGSSRALTLLKPDGTTQRITLPASGPAPGPDIGAVQLGRAGQLVVTTWSGVTILKSATDPRPTGSTLQFPRTRCGPMSPGPGPSPTGAPGPRPTPTPVCRVLPRFVRVGPDGTIWLFYNPDGQHLVVKRIDRYS